MATRAVTKVIITGPALHDPGGVAAYYNAVLPHLNQSDQLAIKYVELGTTRNVGRVLHPVIDQLRVGHAIRQQSHCLLHVNPSLNLRSFLRDGLLVYRAKRAGQRVLVFFRGWEESFETVVERQWHWFFRRTYGQADAFIVLASAFAARLRAWGIRAPIHVASTTVSNELTAGFGLQDVQQRTANLSPVKVLFLARLVLQKGLVETIEGVVALRGRGAAVTLSIAGDGPAMPIVHELARRYDPAGDFICVRGDVRGSAKRGLLASHHVYCFPTYYGEGMPNAVLEAMAFGMPVVTCANGGLRDFFEDGRMGFLVQPRSSQAVVESLAKLLAYPSLLAAMSEHNVTYASRTFGASIVAAKLAAIYREISRAS